MSEEDHPKAPGDAPGDSPAEPAEDQRVRVRSAERRGLEALEAGDFETASDFLLQAVSGYEELGDQKSTNSAAYYFGVSLAAQGKTAQALRVWEEVVERGLDSPSAFTRLIRHYQGQNEPEKVRRLVERFGKAATERTGEFFAAVQQTQNAQHSRERTKAGADPAGRPRALIADDEEGILRVVSRALQLIGYDVIGALDGTQALEAILNEPLDLIILDVFMPGHTGLDVLYRTRAEGIDTDVIVISGKGDEQMVLDAQRLGAEWLGKPFEIEVLADMAKQVLDKRVGRSPGATPPAEP